MAMQLIGVDVGGSGIKAALVDVTTGVASGRIRVETPQPATPDAVVAVVGGLIGKFPIDGPVGCTLPAVVPEDHDEERQPECADVLPVARAECEHGRRGNGMPGRWILARPISYAQEECAHGDDRRVVAGDCTIAPEDRSERQDEGAGCRCRSCLTTAWQTPTREGPAHGHDTHSAPPVDRG